MSWVYRRALEFKIYLPWCPGPMIRLGVLGPYTWPCMCPGPIDMARYPGPIEIARCPGPIDMPRYLSGWKLKRPQALNNTMNILLNPILLAGLMWYTKSQADCKPTGDFCQGHILLDRVHIRGGHRLFIYLVVLSLFKIALGASRNFWSPSLLLYSR